MMQDAKVWQKKFEKEREVANARRDQITELVCENDDLKQRLDLASKYLVNTGPFRGLMPQEALIKLDEILASTQKAGVTS